MKSTWWSNADPPAIPKLPLLCRAGPEYRDTYGWFHQSLLPSTVSLTRANLRKQPQELHRRSDAELEVRKE